MGLAGESPKVNYGFARNYLVPKKLASQRLAVEAAASSSSSETKQSFAASSSAPSAIPPQQRSSTAAPIQANEAYLEEKEKRDAARKRKQFETVIKKLTTVPIVSVVVALLAFIYCTTLMDGQYFVQQKEMKS